MSKKNVITFLIITFVVLLFAILQKSITSPALQSFSTGPMNLAQAKQSEVIELKDGDVFKLTASLVKKTIGGNVVKMLAYNDSIPWPTIKVPQGAEITLKVTNSTDIATTIHSHGVRLENKFDGVPDVTQKIVDIGESFAYRVKFPNAGMYWYHPHFREDYAQELGLYGNYWVIPSDKNYWPPVNREVPLFLDDILLENGNIARFGKTFVNHALMGRFGNTMLVNGETNYSLTVKEGELVRFYFTNAANTRVFNFSIPEATMKLVGGDNGKYEREAFVESVILRACSITIGFVLP